MAARCVPGAAGGACGAAIHPRVGGPRAPRPAKGTRGQQPAGVVPAGVRART
jgi:hypothetical protein